MHSLSSRIARFSVSLGCETLDSDVWRAIDRFAGSKKIPVGMWLASCGK
jgi:hypothetical protein